MTEALDKQNQESFKEIDARLQQLCEEKRKLEQIPSPMTSPPGPDMSSVNWNASFYDYF